jgi:hypothetical protein
MSALAMNWALRDEQVQAAVHGVARSVLVVLADHANAASEAWPSLATVVDESGWSERAVSTALAELEAAGFVVSDGWRQRCRLRRLAITPTSAPPAEVDPAGGEQLTSAPHAEVGPTSAAPAEVPPHDLRTTSAPPAPEPLTGTVNGSRTLSADRCAKCDALLGEDEDGDPVCTNGHSQAQVPKRDDVTGLCDLLAGLMLRNDPRARIAPTSKRWRDAARLLLDVDGRTVDEAERVIRFSQTDDFWRANILSMVKLREKFPQLWMKAGSATAAAQHDRGGKYDRAAGLA